MKPLGLVLLLFNSWLRVEAFAAPTNSCSIAIQQLLHKTVPTFEKEEKSLTLKIGKLFVNTCKYLILIVTFASF